MRSRSRRRGPPALIFFEKAAHCRTRRTAQGRGRAAVFCLHWPGFDPLLEL